MGKVVLENVRKIYDVGNVAVHDFNLEIIDKEFVVFVGPSGCGKSTILRMIAGLEEITDGIIKIDDKVINNVIPKERNIAMVFQNYALYPHMTVFENMAFNLKLRKTPKLLIREAVHNAAEILGLTEYLKRKPSDMSGGQRQRVALGRAIVRKPSVFLFDEPLSNLDAKLRNQMRTELNLLHNTLGVTMIYVTHDQVEAMTMGDKIVVMREGIIQQVADPITLYNYPKNKFVAGFIGMPQMNFLYGKVQNLADKTKVFFDEDFSLELGKSLNFEDGYEIIVGIRSENIGSLAAENTKNAPKIDGIVKVLEPLGSETYVYFNHNRLKLIAKVDPEKEIKVGQKISFPILMKKIHLFDAKTEERIEK